MENIFLLKKNYAEDTQKFKDWFPAEFEKLAQSKMFLSQNFQLMNQVRQTAGLVDTIDFMNDIYDRLGLSIDYAGLCCIKPNIVTPPALGKYRTKFFEPGKDKIFDDSLPNRKCRLHIPVGNNNNLKIMWIDRSENITDENRLNGTFKIESFDVIPPTAYLIAQPGPYKYNNKDNNDYVFFIEVGFENNPDFEFVREKFNSL